MASRISRLITKPFRKSSSEADEEAATSSKKSSQQSLDADVTPDPASVEKKMTFDSEWTKCSCCLKELHQSPSTCVPTQPRFRNCCNCQGCLCKSCRVKGGVCHECTVRREMTLEPDAMMEVAEEKLREYIHMLHYPPDGFLNCPKPYLVKQILVRFQMFDDWDPKKVISPVHQLKPITVPRLDDSAEFKAAVPTSRAIPLGGSKNVSRDSGEKHWYKQLHMIRPFGGSRKAEQESGELSPDQKELCRAEVELAVRRREERQQAAAASGGRDDVTDPSVDQPHHHHHHEPEVQMVELAEVRSADDVRQLNKRQLKYILRKANVDVTNMKGKRNYQQAVVELWNDCRQNGSGSSTPAPEEKKAEDQLEPKAHKQLHRLQYKLPDQPSTSTGRSPVVQLRELPAMSFAEQLSDEQLREILVYHNFDPAEYPVRGDLLYAVLCLWHAIRRGSIAPKIVAKLNERPNRLDLSSKQPEVKIKELASPVDIEKLDPIQLRNILLRHGVNPDQYDTDAELYLGVVNLWSGVQQQEEEEGKGKSPAAANGHHRTVAETAKVVSNWLNQQQPSQSRNGHVTKAPLALIEEDITFIDDDDDFQAIDGRLSSDSD